MALPPSLQSLKFLESCPQLDSILLSASSCTSIHPRLVELLVTRCDQLHRLPGGLGELLLPCLRKLTLRGCESLVELPEDFTSLTRLENLSFPALPSLVTFESTQKSLRGCESLVELPDDFTSLTRLESFVISGSPFLSSLPRNFGQMPALKVLVLESLALSALPNSLCRLNSLEALFLMNCDEIVHLPAEFSRLTALKSLCLVGMRWLVLPEEIGELPGLLAFHMSENEQELLPEQVLLPKQVLLPPSFSQLSSLTDLEFLSCNIRTLPEGM
ncbi:hypothetical protein CLOM_g14850 [Closterium sp. NIES-68]|nr:hypothetical protein CLOM_g14850 [Closterium sp. NIES-68]GJP61994.1 hypothetical protein CLOP_g19105 [Closterium sp. NIES-67]